MTQLFALSCRPKFHVNARNLAQSFPYWFHTHLTPKYAGASHQISCIQECMMDPRADHTSMLPQVFARNHLPNISVRTFSSSGIVTEAASLSLSQYLVLGLGIAYLGK